MRTYSGYLMFEDLLDFIPTTNIVLSQLGIDLTQPAVTVKAADCFTTVGKLVNIDYTIEGLIELATGLPISRTRIDSILATGIYVVAVRHLNSCVQSAGICQQCYIGTYIDKAAPAVGTVTRLAAEYNFKSDVWPGDGASTTFILSQDPTAYSKVLIIVNGLIQMSGYTISGTLLTATTPPALGVHTVVRFYKNTTHSYIGHIAPQYSGALLGMKALPTDTLNIRPSLLESFFSEEQLSVATRELKGTCPTIPSNYFEYIPTVRDLLERAIFIVMLYSLYANVTT